MIQILYTHNTQTYRSEDLRPAFDHLHELRAFVPAGSPMLATTATVTKWMRDEVIVKLDMIGCCVVSESPNKPNICYEVHDREGL